MRGSPAIAAYIGLGSNLGDRSAHLLAGLEAIASFPGTTVVAVSPVIETAPAVPDGRPPGTGGGPYLNAVARIDTTLEPRALLRSLLAAEQSRGRDRSRTDRWGPRTLDLDLLLYGDAVIDEPGLTVPHPRLHQRGFVLEPLAEISPDLVVPSLGRSVADLLRLLAHTPHRRVEVNPRSPAASR